MAIALPVEQVVAGAVTGVGVLGLLVREFYKYKQEKKSNGWRENIIKTLNGQNVVLADLKDKSNQNHEGIEILKSGFNDIKDNCTVHRDNQDKVNLEMKGHLACLDGKVYDLAKKKK